jgi:chromosome segregation and condensation protein ScpB
MTKLTSQLEAIIFSEGGEMKIKNVCDALNLSKGQVLELANEHNASGRGTVLVVDEKHILMRVAGEYASLVEGLRVDAQSEELSKAALEVLAIILYNEGGRMSASEVERVRGVKSSYSLRQLTMRGLLSKARQGMGYRYAPTAELLAHLGITSLAELPDAQAVRQQLREFTRKTET